MSVPASLCVPSVTSEHPVSPLSVTRDECPRRPLCPHCRKCCPLIPPVPPGHQAGLAIRPEAIAMLSIPNKTQLITADSHRTSTKQSRILPTHIFVEPELQQTYSYMDTFSPIYTSPCNLYATKVWLLKCSRLWKKQKVVHLKKAFAAKLSLSVARAGTI